MVSPRAGAFSARFLDQSHENFQTMSLFLGGGLELSRSKRYMASPTRRARQTRRLPGRFDVKGDFQWKYSRPGRGERQEPIPRRFHAVWKHNKLVGADMVLLLM